MSLRPKKVKDFDPNSQDPDWLNPDPVTFEGVKLGGKGSVSGGSQPTPQTQRMHAGSGKLHGSYPRHPQKIRG